MKGTRPLTNSEIRRVIAAFEGTFEIRNRSFFLLGVSIGGRVSEMLAIKIEDVWQNDKPVTDFQFERAVVKGGEISRTIPVNRDGIAAIFDVIAWHEQYFGSIDPSRPLFPSQKSSDGKIKAANRQAIHKILKDAFIKAGLNGKLATHTLRKTFAQRFYQKAGDIYMVKELLGHKNVTTTQAYIGVNYTDAREACESMSLAAEDNKADPFDVFTESELVNKLISLGYAVRKDSCDARY
ncbi:tyrosine-type recombinase/integrase [Candidatus Poribacteria bacterium]|nr:tyrosine-type recombinase/integrase [Candidatus Poribacteria bacterium]MYF98374.1 tyrosine-type recombinase/integrase [Candidatus Poribacteria bacterium]